MKFLNCGVWTLFVLPLIFITGCATPIGVAVREEESDANKDLAEITDVVVDRIEPVKQDGEEVSLPNCSGTGALVQTLESRAAVEEKISISCVASVN